MRQILLVEDSPDDALLLQRALRLAGVSNPCHHILNGAEAIAFLNAKEALIKAGTESPLGFLFLDLKLPDKSGFDILSLMRGRSAFAETLRVVISSVESMDSIRHAYTLGADSFISKPINQTDLIELIGSFPKFWVFDGKSDSTPIDLPEKANPYDTVQVWTQHREIIASLRANLDNLRRELSDTEETFAIIETLKEELRTQAPPHGVMGTKNSLSRSDAERRGLL